MSEDRNTTAVNNYLAGLGQEQRKRVLAISTRVHKLVPDVEERLSYGILGFFYKNKVLVYAGGWESYVSMYPIPSLPEAAHDVAKYQKGKGTLQFPNSQPLPLDFIDAVITGHLARFNAL